MFTKLFTGQRHQGFRALLAAAGLAAGLCAGAAERTSELTVWLVGDDLAVQVLQPAVRAFGQRHPGVRVRLQTVPWGDAVVKYSAAMASKTGPDILTAGLSQAVELGRRGGLVDMARAAPDFDAAVTKTGHPELMKALRGIDGALYGMPYDLSVQLQYLRRDLVARAPATWAELEQEIARQRQAGNGGFMQQWGNVAWIGYFPYLVQAGGALYDGACTRATIDSPQAVQALRFYASLYRRFDLSIDASPDMEAALDMGKVALGQSYLSTIGAIAVARPRLYPLLALAPLPAGPTGRRTAFLGGTVMGVVEHSPRRQLAIEFMRSLYQPEMMREMMAIAWQRNVVWVPGAFPGLVASSPLPAQHREALAAQLQDVQGPPVCPGWQRVQSAVTRAVQAVVVGGEDPAAALAKAAHRMNLALRPL